MGRAGCVESLRHSHVCPSDTAIGLNTHCISLSYWKPSVAMAVTVWSLHFFGILLLNHVCKSDLEKREMSGSKSSLTIVRDEVIFSSQLALRTIYPFKN